jgi:hypothetical protein
MPRYRSYSWDDRYAEEKYYEYLYSECRCPYPDDPEEGDLLCHLCAWEESKRLEAEETQRKKEAALAAHPWREQIVAIRAQIDAVEKAKGLGEKLPAVRILLTNLLSQQAFLAVQPKFRMALLNKVAELRKDPKADPLTELFDHVDTMLEGLKEREDYR